MIIRQVITSNWQITIDWSTSGCLYRKLTSFILTNNYELVMKRDEKLNCYNNQSNNKKYLFSFSIRNETCSLAMSWCHISWYYEYRDEIWKTRRYTSAVKNHYKSSLSDIFANESKVRSVPSSQKSPTKKLESVIKAGTSTLSPQFLYDACRILKWNFWWSRIESS